VLLEGIQTAEQLTMAPELQLDLVVHEFGQVELLEAWQGVLRFSLWLKIDTGMNRLGFPVSAFAAAWARLKALRPAPLELRCSRTWRVRMSARILPTPSSWRRSTAP